MSLHNLIVFLLAIENISVLKIMMSSIGDHSNSNEKNRVKMDDKDNVNP